MKMASKAATGKIRAYWCNCAEQQAEQNRAPAHAGEHQPAFSEAVVQHAPGDGAQGAGQGRKGADQANLGPAQADGAVISVKKWKEEPDCPPKSKLEGANKEA